MKNVQINIKGKVYKVGFRFYLKQIAAINNISGYIKYNTDHSLILDAQGKEEDIDKFIKYCRLGTIASNVMEISLKDLPVKDYRTFEILDN